MSSSDKVKMSILYEFKSIKCLTALIFTQGIYSILSEALHMHIATHNVAKIVTTVLICIKVLYTQNITL